MFTQEQIDDSIIGYMTEELLSKYLCNKTWNPTNYVYLNQQTLKDIELWALHGEHAYHFGVKYLYQPFPFICS